MEELIVEDQALRPEPVGNKRGLWSLILPVFLGMGMLLLVFAVVVRAVQDSHDPAVDSKESRSSMEPAKDRLMAQNQIQIISVAVDERDDHQKVEKETFSSKKTGPSQDMVGRGYNEEEGRHEPLEPGAGPIGPKRGPRGQPRATLPSSEDGLPAFEEPKHVLNPEDLPALAEASLAELQPYRSGYYTLQLGVYCNPDIALKGLESGNNPKLILIPRLFEGKACFTILWGIYDNPGDAGLAAASIPSFFAQEGVKPAIVPLKTYFQS